MNIMDKMSNMFGNNSVKPAVSMNKIVAPEVLEACEDCTPNDPSWFYRWYWVDYKVH